MPLSTIEEENETSYNDTVDQATVRINRQNLLASFSVVTTTFSIQPQDSQDLSSFQPQIASSPYKTDFDSGSRRSGGHRDVVIQDHSNNEATTSSMVLRPPSRRHSAIVARERIRVHYRSLNRVCNDLGIDKSIIQ